MQSDSFESLDYLIGDIRSAYLLAELVWMERITDEITVKEGSEGRTYVVEAISADTVSMFRHALLSLGNLTEKLWPLYEAECERRRVERAAA